MKTVVFGLLLLGLFQATLAIRTVDGAIQYGKTHPTRDGMMHFIGRMLLAFLMSNFVTNYAVFAFSFERWIMGWLVRRIDVQSG
jgi:hypothetical protein